MPLTPDERPPDVGFEERRKMNLWERFDALEQECRRGHRDLRKATNELEAQADALEREIKSLSVAMAALAVAPVEATKLRFSPQVLVVIFTATITVSASVIGAASTVRSDMRNINTRMDSQQQAAVDAAKLADQRYAEITKALERQEQQRREDKAASENRLKKYDNDELLRDLRRQGVSK
jgi:hypothetical protein